MPSAELASSKVSVPFFRPSITKAELEEVADTLRTGWLTTGPKVKRFETEFATSVRAEFGVALNSGTAALHLAVEALNLQPGQAVLIPTMTFAATAEVVRYKGAIPVLVDCDPETLNIDLQDAARKLEYIETGRLLAENGKQIPTVGIIPVHVGGLMVDMDAVKAFARERQLWIVEDAAHAFPAAWRRDKTEPWRSCGQGDSEVACFSFYANKTITTGEGGMAVTNRADLAERMRMMSLHGLSRDAWGRYLGGSWDYKIMAPGFKYNLTDVAAALGIHQLARAEEMRRMRESIATAYLEGLGSVEEIDLPSKGEDRIHSWHLFPIRLCLEKLAIDRNQFIEALKRSGIGCSVHWRPLHLHPYYQETFGWRPEEFRVSTGVWERLISLPIFPDMRDDELEHVVTTVKALCVRYAR